MGLSTGFRLGPYEIVSQLGAGGMGEVYRARDTRLDRTVAIKVLNSALVASPELRARFEREARVVSQLQHPHICVLHDIGNDGGTDFLVMEFLDGESLAERLRKGPLSNGEFLKIAVQIADALERAHRAGIVHRDLKPANVMLTKTGAKLLDFGLAKPLAAGAAAGTHPSKTGLSAAHSSASVFSAALTMTSPAPSPAGPLSTAGAVLGTIQYMSPEQIQGIEADERSDIFAYGLLLFEMGTGKRAFEGKNQAAVVGAILANDPPLMSSLRPGIPASLDRLVQTCVRKEPDERFQTMHDVKLRLVEIGENVETSAAGPARRQLLAWIGAALLLLALVGLGVMYATRSAPAAGPVQLSFNAPANLAFNEAVADSAVISPDGTKLAFSATSREGKWQLWVRSLDSPSVQLIPGSDDPLEPFWSPDSRSIAFGSLGKLKRADLAGGGAQVLCDAARMTGGAWSSAGVIVFGSDYGSVLYQVPANGGEPKPVTVKLSGEADFGHGAPAFLPDGKHFLFHININTDARGVWVGELDSPERKHLLQTNSNAIYASGYLLFVSNGALMAQAFDAKSLKLSGEAAPIVSQGTGFSSTWSGRFSVSDNGVLVWQPEWQREYQLRWFSREGKELGRVGEVVTVNSGEEPHLSPDGTQVVLKMHDAASGPEQRSTANPVSIWVMDLQRGTGIRLTSGQLPLWGADGKHVIYQSAVVEKDIRRRGIVREAANGVGEPDLLTQGVKFPHAITPDGRFILYLLRGEKTRLDIWVLPMTGDKKEYPLLNSAFDERDPQISPDGKWLAYTSDESGSYEVYVRSFTADGKVGDDKRRISVHTGQQPVWNRNGKELFYLTDDGQLMLVMISGSGAGPSFAPPRALFKVRMLSPFNISHEYDVSPDGQRFLIGTLAGERNSDNTNVMLNWQAELKK